MNKTILYDIEIMHGAKMAEKNNVTLPKVFSAENIEADAVKDKCVMFDLTDKAKVLISGNECYMFCNYLGTKIIQKDKITKTIILDDEANIIDIVKMYYLDEQNIIMVVGIASFEKTFNYILDKSNLYDVEIKLIKDNFHQIALMGVESKNVLSSYLKNNYKNEHNIPKIEDFNSGDFIYQKDGNIKVYYHETRLADTFGLMGEESEIKKIYSDLSMNPNVLLGGSESYNILRKRARRLEYGVDIDNTINPYEASLEALIDYSHDFIGRNELLKLSMIVPSKKFVGVEFDLKNITDNSFDIYNYGVIVGRVTSVCHETSVKCIGVGFIDTEMLNVIYQFNNPLRIKVGKEYIPLRIVEM